MLFKLGAVVEEISERLLSNCPVGGENVLEFRSERLQCLALVLVELRPGPGAALRRAEDHQAACVTGNWGRGGAQAE